MRIRRSAAIAAPLVPAAIPAAVDGAAAGWLEGLDAANPATTRT